MKRKSGGESGESGTGMHVKKFKLHPSGRPMCGCGSSLNWPLKKTILKQTSRHFYKFLYAHPRAIPEWANIMRFRPRHPKWDQNLQFTPLSETMSIPFTFYMGVSPAPPLPPPPDENLYKSQKILSQDYPGASWRLETMDLNTGT